MPVSAISSKVSAMSDIQAQFSVAEADRRPGGRRGHFAADPGMARTTRLNRVNVLDFSKSSGLDEERVISGFLHASRLGLFDMKLERALPRLRRRARCP